MRNTITFMTANYVAREAGYTMHAWGHGDRTTNEAFSPIETYVERIDALLADIGALGFDTIDLWGAHLSPDWATDAHGPPHFTGLAGSGPLASQVRGHGCTLVTMRASDIA